MRTLSVVHIEDDPLWCDIVAKIIHGMPSLCYLGHAENLENGLVLVETMHPDLLVLDLRLPDSQSFDIVARFEVFRPAPRILILSAVMKEAILVSLNRGCIAGMVWKAAWLPQTLPQAFREIAAGRRYFSAEVHAAIANARRQPDAFFKIVSKRELELLPLLGRGDTNAEIAQSTGLQPLTVKSHREHLLAKLGLHSSEKLMRWAAEKGFVNFDGH